MSHCLVYYLVVLAVKSLCATRATFQARSRSTLTRLLNQIMPPGSLSTWTMLCPKMEDKDAARHLYKDWVLLSSSLSSQSCNSLLGLLRRALSSQMMRLPTQRTVSQTNLGPSLPQQSKSLICRSTVYLSPSLKSAALLFLSLYHCKLTPFSSFDALILLTDTAVELPYLAPLSVSDSS